MSDSAYGWALPDEGQDGLAAGDLSNSDLVAQYLDQINREEYYSSERFAVGYSELQAMWSTRNKDKENIPDFSLSAERGESPFVSRERFDASRRRRSMVLPLQDALSMSSSSSGHLEVPHSRRSSRKWSSSVGVSPLGTPSPMSETPSPIYSTPNESLTSSPRLGGGQKLHQASSKQSEASLSPERCESEENLDRECEDLPKRGKQRPSILDAIRRIIEQFRGKSVQSCTKLNSDHQVAELEAELESYRQLSESKRRAADLLKHQLMEVLYEKVVSEVEERHKRRHLEEEMMSLEFELHLLRSTTEESIRGLTQQLQRVLTEKTALQRQMKYLTEDDNGHDYHQLLYSPEAITSDGTARRASY